VAKTGTKGGGPKDRSQSKRRPPARKKGEKRPHSVSLADLYLWITLVDECLYHPIGAFERAAVTAGLKNRGTVTQRVKVLEAHFGQLFANRDASQRYRSGVALTPLGGITTRAVEQPVAQARAMGLRAQQ
jgi:hypothetical protein